MFAKKETKIIEIRNENHLWKKKEKRYRNLYLPLVFLLVFGEWGSVSCPSLHYTGFIFVFETHMHVSARLDSALRSNDLHHDSLETTKVKGRIAIWNGIGRFPALCSTVFFFKKQMFVRFKINNTNTQSENICIVTAVSDLHQKQRWIYHFSCEYEKLKKKDIHNAGDLFIRIEGLQSIVLIYIIIGIAALHCLLLFWCYNFHSVVYP